MKQIKGLLNKYAQSIQLGDDDPKVLDTAALALDLKTVYKTNNIFFTVCTAMVICLFIFSFVLILLFINSPGKISIVFSVTGVSTAWLVRTMIKSWKQKSYIDIITVLTASLNTETNSAIITLLSKKLK